MAQRVTQAIRQASAKTGVDFAYMLANANQESGLNPKAKAATSSATGLYQFVEQTWLRMVKTYGEKYGLGSVASRITIGNDGVARVADTPTKNAILALRKDPQTSACMAAELTNENKDALECKTGMKAGATELYLAHFLGASGAAEFLNAMRAKPGATAADVMPEAAAANPSVFYGKDGKAKTLAEVYQKFAQKFEGAGQAPATRVAAAGSSAASQAVWPVVGAGGVAGSFVMPSLPFSLASTGSGFRNAYRTGTELSAPFATMALAQMDAGAPGTETAANDDAKKKTQAMRAAG